MSSIKSDSIASANDLGSALASHYEGLMRSLHLCIPAFITEYDRHSHKATVQPLIKGAYFNGEWKYIEPCRIKVSVRSIQQGGFTIDMPIFVGDTGWVVSSDRDTTLLKQDGALTNSVLDKDRDFGTVETAYQQKPHQPRIHVMEDGFFIPDNWGVFDFNKFKDSTYVDIGGSLYIGNSFDTADKRIITKEELKEQALAELGGLEEPKYGETERQAKEREKKNTEKEIEAEKLAEKRVEKYEKLLQHGRGYLTHTTSSLVVEKGFGIHLLSTPKGYGRDSRVSAKQNKVEMSIEDNDYGSVINATVGVREGVRIEARSSIWARSSDVSELRVSFADGVTSIQIGGSLKILIRKGNLVIENSGKMELNAGGSISLSAKDGISVLSSSDYVIHDGSYRGSHGVNIVASGDVTVSSDKNVSLESNQSISCFCGGDMKVSSGDDMEISSGALTMDVGGKFKLNSGNDLDMNLLDRKLMISDQCLENDGSGVDFKSSSDIDIETHDGKSKLKLSNTMDFSSELSYAGARFLGGSVTTGPIDATTTWVQISDFRRWGVINQMGEWDSVYFQRY